MSYTPTNWQSGDVVTSEKLNKLENGVENADANGLPAVTESNSGQVLTVIAGKWDSAWPTTVTTVNMVEATGDGETPETFTCNDTASSMYISYIDHGVAINGSMVISATAEYDDVSGDTSYTFITLALNNGSLIPIVWTANTDDDNPSYTES